MKNIILILAFMITGVLSAQDLSSVTATATAKSYDKAGMVYGQTHLKV